MRMRPPMNAVSRSSGRLFTDPFSSNQCETTCFNTIQHQRIFLVTTSAETGSPSWILMRSISP